MPRIAREIILFEPKIVHKTIHSHNKDRNFEHPSDKNRYLDLLTNRYPNNHSQIHAFCAMDNHIHELYSVTNQKEFSNFMRDHLSLYAQYFNKKYDRHGRVTNERPATKLVENDRHEMNCIFYIHANAFDIVENIDDFEYSTHHLYAYGIRSHHTKNIILPNWYMELGTTPLLRQNHYQIMFEEYLALKKLKPMVS